MVLDHYSLLSTHFSKLSTPLHRGRGRGVGPGLLLFLRNNLRMIDLHHLADMHTDDGERDEGGDAHGLE